MRTYIEIHDHTEIQWGVFMKNVIKNFELSELYIPIVDLSDSMYDGVVPPINMAITMSLIFTQLCSMPLISFSANPHVFNIAGNAFAKIKCIHSETLNNTEFNNVGLNFVDVFTALMSHILSNKIHFDMVKKMNVVVLTDREFNHDVDNSDIFDKLDLLFVANNYIRPRLIFWNMRGKTMIKHLPHNIIIMNGINTELLSYFIKWGKLDLYSQILDIITPYKKLVI